jgi:hypothetical protein
MKCEDIFAAIEATLLPTETTRKIDRCNRPHDCRLCQYQTVSTAVDCQYQTVASGRAPEFSAVWQCSHIYITVRTISNSLLTSIVQLVCFMSLPFCFASKVGGKYKL